MLRTIWDNLLEKEAKGDALAGHIRRNLRILTAGGDGTVTWVLKTIQDLRLDPAPAVAVMPLGTGNDLALSFGWGNMFLPDWIRVPRLYRTLKRYADAEVRLLDSWRVDFSAPAPGMFDDTPHSLTVPDAGANGASGSSGADLARTATGSFWNYFSVGLDAEAAYGFHSLRESKPWAASTRLMNQAWYSYFSCTTGRGGAGQGGEPGAAGALGGRDRRGGLACIHSRRRAKLCERERDGSSSSHPRRCPRPRAQAGSAARRR